MKKAILLGLSFSILALLSPAGAEPANAEIETKLNELSARWEKARLDLELPALAIAVVHGDRTVFAKGYGTTEPGGGEAVTASTPFYIASSTKPFTAMGIVMLADEGKLDLDAPVRRYLPAFELKDAELTKKSRSAICSATVTGSIATRSRFARRIPGRSMTPSISSF